MQLPWIISASDDQTIRIWNWLNRTLLTTVTGHDHYVMSAFFHPTQDLIVSSSLDQSIRVWDYSTLRKKFFEARSNAYEVLTMDVTVKFKLEGHDRGVNWAVFHPTLMLIASGADDKNIKIWKYSDTKCTEADTLRGHFNNVSSVVFHPKLDILISNSEDKSLRIWDLAKKSCIEKVAKETDRFWIVAAHPTLNLFACGSDSGLFVFKLESTRIPSVCIPGNRVIYYQNKELKLWKHDDTEKKLLITSKFNSKTLRHGIKRIVYNPHATSPNNFVFGLVCDDSMNKSVYYYNLKIDNNNRVLGEEQCLDAQSICFISKEKGLFLRNSVLFIFDCANPSKASTVLEIPGITKDIVEDIFQAPLGKFIIKLKNEVIGLVDANSKKIINELNEISELKNVVWNSNMTNAGLIGKNSIYLISKNFEILNKMRENSSIKSACFDENSVLFYTTHFHIKYFLADKGLSGIIKSIKTTNYLMMVHSSKLFYSDSLQQLKSEDFNYIDCKFNVALQNKNYDEIVNILRKKNIFGKKLVENIQNAGFPDLSLNYVSDIKQKFQLALESEKLEVFKS
jgi:coatomer protein complex subunit alpha (xenin)